MSKLFKNIDFPIKKLKEEDETFDSSVPPLQSGFSESFVYRPPCSISKLLKSESEDIKKILGIHWEDAMAFSLAENIDPLLAKLEDISDVGFIKTFSVSGNRWKERVGSIFKIPGEDVIFYNTDFGFVCRRRDWEKIKVLISQVSLSPSSYDEKSLDKVFWDQKTESLKRDILFFSKSKDWFDKRDLPYSRSYLLYGPPGNGKTSTIRAISKFFHTTPSQFSFTGRYEDPDSAFLQWVGGEHEEDDYYTESQRPRAMRSYLHSSDDSEDSRPRIRILLLEDIDRFFSKEEGFKTPVSFSAILNALDGVAQRKNSILIATANNPEKIDSQVLFRPGRFDLRIPFEAPSREGIRSFLTKLSEEDSISLAMVEKVADSARGHSLAFVKGVYLAAANKAFARASTQICDEDIAQSLQEFLSNLGKDIKSSKGGAGF